MDRGVLKLLYARKSIRVFVWFSVIFLGFAIVSLLLRPVLIPCILSLTLYVLFEPINIALLRRGVPSSQSAIFVVAIILLILYAFVAVIVPMLSEQFYLLLERLPAIMSSVEQLANNMSQQMIDNLLVIPLVIADAVSLHPLMVIVGLIIFGSYFGLLGMLVAIPVLATAKIIFHGLNRGLQVQAS